MTSMLLKSMVILFALLCIGGCADSETNSTEEMPNNDIGKISFTGRYYIDNSVLYSEDDTGKRNRIKDS